MSVKKRRKNGTFLTGADIGTAKICIVTAEMSDSGMDVLSITSTPSAGIRKGVVVNMDEATAAIRAALAAACEDSGVAVREAILSLSGSHIMTGSSSASVAVGGRTIAQGDIDKVIDAAGSAPIPAGREIIHALPVEFIVDGCMGIKDPLGMPGSRLETKMNIITAASEPLQRLVMSCEKAGLHALDFAAHSIASAESVLTTEEREMGTALVDIGAGTTDIALFRDGWLVGSAELGIGGNHFSNDLCVGLSIPFREAERIKKQYGSLAGYGAFDAGDAGIDAVDVYEIVKKISGGDVCEILRMRGEELLGLIKDEITGAGDGEAITGVVFTGGGALMQSFERLAEQVLGMSVRIGRPDIAPKQVLQSAPSLPFTSDIKEEFNGPQYAAAAGLVLYGSGCMMEKMVPGEEGLFTKVTGFFSNIMGRKK
jgi:cell division protein FtsA